MRHDLALAWNGIALAGPVHLPSGPPPHPAILMLQGSGAADRDADGYFALFRDTFLRRGVVALAFD